MTRVLTKQRMCESSYCALFFTDPLVTSCTAHKNMFLLRAFQDIHLTAGFLQVMLPESSILWPFSRHTWAKCSLKGEFAACLSCCLQTHPGTSAQQGGACEASPRGSLSGCQKLRAVWPTVQQESYHGSQGPEERAGLLLPATQQGEQLNFAALPSGSPVDFACWIAFVTLPSLFPCQHLLWTLLGIYIQPKVFLDLLYQPCARDEFPCAREIFHPISSALLCWHTKWINRL